MLCQQICQQVECFNIHACESVFSPFGEIKIGEGLLRVCQEPVSKANIQQDFADNLFNGRMRQGTFLTKK